VNLLACLFAFLKSVIYGSSVYFTAELVASTDVLDILALRFLLSFAAMWLLKVTKLVHIRVGVKDFLRKNDRSEFMKTLLFAALFEPVLYMLFETLGISMTTGVTAGVILSLSPIFSCILESIFLKEKTTILQKFFLALGIVGAIYITLHTDTAAGRDSAAGILFLFLAVITGSLFAVFSRKASAAFSAMERTYISCMLGAAAFNLANIVRHTAQGTLNTYFAPYFSLNNMIGFIFLAILSTIVATAMNNYALGKMQVSSMSAFGGVSTLVTVAVGVVFGGEHLELYHIIGLTLIMARIVGVTCIAAKKEKAAAKTQMKTALQ